MTLKQTKILLAKYQDALSQDELDDVLIKKLLDQSPFHQSVNAPDENKPMDDDNFDRLQGIRDFIVALGGRLSSQRLHRLTTKLLALTPALSSSLQEDDLTKCMLGYQKMRDTNKAQMHWNQGQPIEQQIPKKSLDKFSTLIDNEKLVFEKLIDKKWEITSSKLLPTAKVKSFPFETPERSTLEIIKLTTILEKINDIYERSEHSKGWFIDTSKSKAKAKNIKQTLAFLSASEILTLDTDNPTAKQKALLKALATPRSLFSFGHHEARAKAEIKALIKRFNDLEPIETPRLSLIP